MSPASRAAKKPARRGKRRHVVVTAGPTREHVDPVRYMTNESSGKMGFEIARAAAEAGDRVTLVAGPVWQETPPGVDRVDVVSARDMLAAVRTAFRDELTSSNSEATTPTDVFEPKGSIVSVSSTRLDIES